MVKHMVTKLDWYSTLFPRIPVPIQKDLEKKMSDRNQAKGIVLQPTQLRREPPRTNG